MMNRKRACASFPISSFITRSVSSAVTDDYTERPSPSDIERRRLQVLGGHLTEPLEP